ARFDLEAIHKKVLDHLDDAEIQENQPSDGSMQMDRHPNDNETVCRGWLVEPRVSCPRLSVWKSRTDQPTLLQVDRNSTLPKECVLPPYPALNSDGFTVAC